MLPPRGSQRPRRGGRPRWTAWRPSYRGGGCAGAGRRVRTRGAARRMPDVAGVPASGRGPAGVSRSRASRAAARPCPRASTSRSPDRTTAVSATGERDRRDEPLPAALGPGGGAVHLPERIATTEQGQRRHRAPPPATPEVSSFRPAATRVTSGPRTPSAAHRTPPGRIPAAADRATPEVRRRTGATVRRRRGDAARPASARGPRERAPRASPRRVRSRSPRQRYEQEDPMKRRLPLVALAGAQFVMVLDQSVMNVSISQLVDDFDTTVTDDPGGHHPLLPRDGDAHAHRRQDRRHHRPPPGVRHRPRHLRAAVRR